MVIDILWAFDPAVLAAFVLAGLLLNITPGADFVFVTASGIAGGPRQGMAAALGINLGVALHIFAAAAGVSALILAYPSLYHIIRWAGAAYLLFLAIQTWRASSDLTEGQAEKTVGRSIWRGFVTNVLNPKTALFIFAFIPQWTDPNIGPVWAQILILGAIFQINGFVFSLCLGAAAGALSTWLRGKAHALARLSSLMFGGLALRLALD